MAAYVSGPGLAWVLEYPDEDVRDVTPVIHELMQSGRVLTLHTPAAEPGQPDMRTLINFSRHTTVFVSADRPGDEEIAEGRGPRMFIRLTLGETRQE